LSSRSCKAREQHPVLIDLDRSVRPVAEDILIPNGMAVTPEGKALYAVDSGRKVVFSFVVDPDTGDLSERKVVVEVAGAPIPRVQVRVAP
jgi:sugar lactone lactonase YvrE